MAKASTKKKPARKRSSAAAAAMPELRRVLEAEFGSRPTRKFLEEKFGKERLAKWDHQRYVQDKWVDLMSWFLGMDRLSPDDPSEADTLDYFGDVMDAIRDLERPPEPEELKLRPTQRDLRKLAELRDSRTDKEIESDERWQSLRAAFN